MGQGESYIIGIDQGTTGTKALAMAADGSVAASAYAAHRQIYPAEGHVEHDAREIWGAVRQTIVSVCADLPRGAPIGAVGLANQGETVLAWDLITGEPLYNALVWQDMRTQAAVDALAEDGAFARHVVDATGLRLDPYFSAPKLRWLLDHVPAVQQAHAAGRLALSTLDAWLLWKLTGGASYLTDVSTAARTLCFDIHRGAYDEQLTERFGIPRETLPAVVPSDGRFGLARLPEAGLNGVPVRASLVDQPAAMLGHGCIAEGHLKATYGTGCFVYLHTGSKPRPSQTGLLTTVAWQRDGTYAYALDGGIFAAGSVVTWLKDQLGLIADAAAIDSLALGVEDTGGVVCIPALAGLAAPHWSRRARGAVLGMGLGTGRREVVRAALEGIAWQVAEVVSAMAQDSGLAIDRLRVDGGLTGSAALMQLQADVLGIDVVVAAEAEATAMGVCYLASRAIGQWRDDEPIRARSIAARVYRPRWDQGRRAAARARFQGALRLISEWSK
jgi:glycerol kinase